VHVQNADIACFSPALGGNIGHLPSARRWIATEAAQEAVQAKPWSAGKAESVGALEYYPAPYIEYYPAPYISDMSRIKAPEPWNLTSHTFIWNLGDGAGLGQLAPGACCEVGGWGGVETSTA